jgi:hypothetical protein
MFAWLTEPGVYHGKIKTMGESLRDNIMEDNQLLP